MIKLEVFEKTERCNLRDFETSTIKENIVYHINSLNHGLEKGFDPIHSYYMNSYESELAGMISICAIVGITVRTTSLYEKKKDPCTEQKSLENQLN